MSCGRGASRFDSLSLNQSVGRLVAYYISIILTSRGRERKEEDIRDSSSSHYETRYFDIFGFVEEEDYIRK
jgi:hypothetical protein